SRWLHRSLQFSGSSPVGRNTCRKHVWKLWRRTEQDRTQNRVRMASFANDNSISAAGRVRHVLLSTNWPSFYSIRDCRAVLHDSNQHRTGERECDISEALRTTISRSEEHTSELQSRSDLVCRL